MGHGSLMHVKNTTKLCQSASLLLAGLVLAACNTSGTSGSTAPEDALGVGQQSANASNTAEDQSRNLRGFCPRTVIRTGTETYREFDPPLENGSKPVNFQSTINQVARECNYSGSNLNIRVGVRGTAINGPTGKTGDFIVPIRVAVVDAAKEVKYSVLHQVPVTIPSNKANASFSYVDSNINLPAPDKPNLIVYVGFDEGPPGESEDN